MVSPPVTRRGYIIRRMTMLRFSLDYPFDLRVARLRRSHFVIQQIRPFQDRPITYY